MIRPNFIGAKTFYFNPAADDLSTAEMAAVDTPYGAATVSPYAYTATVRNDYDAFNFFTDDGGSNLAASSRIAWGLFLTPENDKGNLLFQVSGKALFSHSNGAGEILRGSFFFGRKATNNTVVSSKAAASNTLAQYEMLPNTAIHNELASSSYGCLDMSIQTEIFSLALNSGFVYCFGFYLDNITALSEVLYGGVHLSFRKYGSELDVFRSSR